MPTYYPKPDQQAEPKQRFYPTQGAETQPRIPSAPTPSVSLRSSPAPHPFIPDMPSRQQPVPRHSRQKNDDASYLMHRHPILLQRLYDTAETYLAAYRTNDFIYDPYPDYVSLRLMRDRLLRESTSLTEDFLQSGCPIEWLNLLTDTVISELLCRMRFAYRNPRGEANTTSVRSASRS